MESGVINRENLSSIFRAVSQRRRQGEFQIVQGEEQTKILFFQGKIVEVINNAKLPAMEVAELLDRAGLITLPAGSNFETYAALFDKLNSLSAGEPVDEVLFKRAIKHRVLNGIYALEALSGAYYTFKVQMVDYERDFAPSISVGQVLLDLVALANEAGRFNSTFAPSVVVQPGQAPDQPLSDDEKIVVELIGAGLSVEELRSRALLSRYHFQDVLLGLLDRGVIAVQAAPVQKSVADKLTSQELLSALDRSIDQAFQEESGLVQAEESFTRGWTKADQPPSAAAAAEAPAAEMEIAAPSVLRARLINWNTLLVQQIWVPRMLAIIFFLGALLLPLFFWHSLYWYFAK